MNQFEHYADKILTAHDYTDLFGEDKINVQYRELAYYVHPDGRIDYEKALAAEAFQKLVEYKAEALHMAAEGRWGEKRVLATITSRKGRYEVTRSLADGDLSKLWLATTTLDGVTEQVAMKIALSPKDNDLLTQEARALKLLHKEEHPLTRHYPLLLDTFLHSEGRRRTNVLEYFDSTGWFTIDDVSCWFDHGVPGPHLAWIWRKLLMALGHAHDQGLVHGAVWPSHILVQPELHAVVLIDWCYSVVIDSESNTYVKALVPMYKNSYPEEVLAKEKPTPATDLHMAATSMMFAGGNAIPASMRAYFNGTRLTKQAMRPQNAWLLLEEFDELLKAMGGPYYPRRFVKMPTPARAG